VKVGTRSGSNAQEADTMRSSRLLALTLALVPPLWLAACDNVPLGFDGVSPPDAAPPGPAPADPGVPPVQCSMWTTAVQVEENLVLPKCGKLGDSTCHGNGPFPPKMAAVGLIVPNLLDKKPLLSCQGDKLINRADPGKSFILAKVGTNDFPSKAVCPSTGRAEGGDRMPYSTAAMPLPRLSQEEIDCLTWWVYEVAK
jgi:hypothetical protein